MLKNKIFLIHLFFIVYSIITALCWPLFAGKLGGIPPTMIWNVFLALLAYDFINWMIRAKSKISLVISSLFSFLFYPNTFYMITDAKHVADWFPDLKLTFINTQEIIAFVILLVGIIFGTLLGMEAMRLVLEVFFRKSWQKLLFVIGMSFLSSVAIYGGRISTLRLNSWDVFIRPIDTIEKLFSIIRLDNMVFLVSFTVYQVFVIGLGLWFSLEKRE